MCFVGLVGRVMFKHFGGGGEQQNYSSRLRKSANVKRHAADLIQGRFCARKATWWFGEHFETVEEVSVTQTS